MTKDILTVPLPTAYRKCRYCLYKDIPLQNLCHSGETQVDKLEHRQRKWSYLHTDSDKIPSKISGLGN
jgi:hypothetical protein